MAKAFSVELLTAVMPGLGPGIHVFRAAAKAWMAGPSPAMTSSILIGKSSKTRCCVYFP
jgi:hypothetical protein